MIIQRFNLNLIPNQSPVIVHVNQYDTGTGRLIATLYEGNEPYSPSGTAVIQGTKPDGHGFQYSATLNGNVVTADLTEQMSPVAGDVRAQIVVTESSGVTGTFVFIMRVQPSALPSDTEMSESDYQYIEEAIREAQEAVQTAQEATETAQEAVERAEAAITETQENAEDSEAWAQGTRGGIPVEPTDPTYEHNAEYWAQYAERYAQGGLHYKGSIPFVDIPTTGMREGDMYNITDDFTTDSRFEEGAGIEVKGGTNIAWNSDDKWDVLALPPKTTFNGRSGSILPMAGDYDSKKILLSSALHIGGETQENVQKALEALSDDGVKSFNGRSGSILPMAGDYDSEKILLASVLHIGGETQENVQKALEALSNDGVKSFNGRSGSVLPMAGDYSAEQVNYDSNQTVKQKIDALVTKEASDIAGQQSLVKDTVGWTGKNRLPYPYYEKSKIYNGITFTVNNDGSVTVNGTATAGATFNFTSINNTGIRLNGDYIISGNSAFSASGMKFTIEAPVGTNNNVEGANDVKYTFNNTEVHNIRLWIPSGTTIDNVTIYPMLRKADITDPTYEPYHESVEVMYEEEIHGVNLFNIEPFTRTSNGITITVADNIITLNGTPSANGGFTIRVFSSSDLVDGETYTISDGNASNYSNCYIYINGEKYDGSAVYDVVRLQTKATLKTDFSTYRKYIFGVYIRTEAGTLSNKKFYPMLRKADIEDSTYRPYNYQAIQHQLNAQGVLGAKNLLENKATTQTLNGVTFTVNTDGSVTVNGTASANTSYVLRTKTPLAAGKSYIMSRGEVGDADFQMVATAWNSGSYVKNIIEVGAGGYTEKSFVADYNGYNDIQISIFVRSGKTISNAKVYPMIRLASDPDDTYQPYTMTNRELTEENNARFNMEMQSGDVLSVNRTCFFFAAAGCTNLPVSDRGCLVQMIYNTANFKTCLVSPYNIPDIYINVKAGQNWSGWRKFTSTAV